MKMIEVRALTEQELVAKKRELRQENFNLRLQQASGQLEKPSRLRELRRNVARLETALSEKRKGLSIQSRQPSTGKTAKTEKAEKSVKKKASARSKS